MRICFLCQINELLIIHWDSKFQWFLISLNKKKRIEIKAKTTSLMTKQIKRFNVGCGD